MCGLLRALHRLMRPEFYTLMWPRGPLITRAQFICAVYLGTLWNCGKRPGLHVWRLLGRLSQGTDHQAVSLGSSIYKTRAAFLIILLLNVCWVSLEFPSNSNILEKTIWLSLLLLSLSKLTSVFNTYRECRSRAGDSSSLSECSSENKPNLWPLEITIS